MAEDCPDRPNIVFITTDQQRFDTWGDVAPDFLRTPHLDQLGWEGISFSAAYSDCPVCVPARVSIMNGNHATTHGMTGNGRTASVLGRTETLPARLRELGYQTAAIGKMHFGPQRCRHGFDEMILPDDYYREMRRRGSELQPMRHGLGQNEMYPTMATVPEAQTLTSWTARQCVSYIRDRRDPTVPFFLWCSFSKPHPPLDPPEPYYSMYRNMSMPSPAKGEWAGDEACPPILKQTRQGMKYDTIPEELWADIRAAYYGLITQIDYNIGQVLGALQDRKLYNNTVVIFTSDHGEMLGDHYTAAKCHLYEGSAHVPMILRLPPQYEERHHGTKVDTPVTVADILPTIVHLAGGEADNVDGSNLLETVRGENDRQYVLSVAGANVRCVAITDGQWKYLWFSQGGYEQLFDLCSDPYEEKNLADSPTYKNERKRLREALISELKKRNSNYVADDDPTVEPFDDVPERDVRAGCGLGLHTDEWPHDVRH